MLSGTAGHLVGLRSSAGRQHWLP